MIRASALVAGREALLENVGAVNANFPMRCEDGPDRYHQLVGEIGQFDVLHLGLGTDGRGCDETLDMLELARVSALLHKVKGEESGAGHDASTQGLLGYYLANKA